MRLTLFSLACLLCVAVACGGPSTPPPVEPVKDTPLAGTVAGQAWTAAQGTASAHRAFSDDGGERWIDVSQTAWTCSSYASADLIGVVPWAVGGYNLSLMHNLTFVVRQADGGLDNLIATSGRVELMNAPDAGTATIRIRAKFDAANSIEGQVDLTVCD